MAEMCYCPYCGNVLDESYKIIDLDRIIHCRYCGGDIQWTGKDEKEVAKLAKDELDDPTRYDDYIRKHYVYNNPLFNPKREQLRLEEIERIKVNNKAQSIANAVAEATGKRIKCPSCGNYNVARIGALERGASVAAWGLFSKKINKSFKCATCGHTW